MYVYRITTNQATYQFRAPAKNCFYALKKINKWIRFGETDVNPDAEVIEEVELVMEAISAKVAEEELE